MTSTARRKTASRRRRKGSAASIRRRPSATGDTVIVMRRASLLALALLLLPGCGGGTSKPLTKEEYASKADVICGKYNEQIKSFANPKNLSDLAKVAEKTLPILDHAIGDLSKLTPPASEKALSD